MAKKQTEQGEQPGRPGLVQWAIGKVSFAATAMVFGSRGARGMWNGVEGVAGRLTEFRDYLLYLRSKGKPDPHRKGISFDTWRAKLAPKASDLRAAGVEPTTSAKEGVIEREITERCQSRFVSAWLGATLGVGFVTAIGSGFIGGPFEPARAASSLGIVALFGGYAYHMGFANYQLRRRDFCSGLGFKASPSQWMPRWQPLPKTRAERAQACRRSERAFYGSLIAAIGVVGLFACLPVGGSPIWLALAMMLALALCLGNAATASVENHRLRTTSKGVGLNEPLTLAQWMPKAKLPRQVAKPGRAGQSGSGAVATPDEAKAT